MYTQAHPHVASPDAAIKFSGASTPDIAVDRGWLHTASGRFDESPDQPNIISVVAGRISLDFGRRGTIMNTPGDSYLYPPDSPGDLQWDAFGALTVRLTPQLVNSSAAELKGMNQQALRFTSPQPVSASHGRLWLRTVEMLWQELSAPDRSEVNALVHRALVNLTAATAVSVFPNTTMTRGYVPGPGDVSPAAVRRAQAYIDSHASLPITVTDIADAAGTDPRGLRAAFRRHLDTTPTSYLRRARLEGAHLKLLAADHTDGTTVAQVSSQWGYRNPDRFATAYRAVYGVPPSRTLRS